MGNGGREAGSGWVHPAQLGASIALLPQAPQQVGLGLYFADVPEHCPFLLHSLAPALDLCFIKQTVICF